MDDQKKAAMNPEQAADLAALEAMAAGVPGRPSDAPAPPVQDAGRPELQAELAALFMLAAQTVATVYPSVKDTLNQQATDTLAAVWAAVCNKHGWMQSGIGGEYAEEIAAAAVTLPLGFALYAGIKSDIAARGKNSKESAPATAAIESLADAAAPAGDADQSFNLGAAVAPPAE